MKPDLKSQITQSWFDERQSAYLYNFLSEKEGNPKRKKMFQALGKAALDQAELWRLEYKKATSQEMDIPFNPPLRAKITATLIKLLGPQSIKPLLAGMKIRGLSVYGEDFPDLEGRAHSVTGELKKTHSVHSSQPQGGQLRAAVFGFSDGLVSNASLMMGIAGAQVDEKYALLTGVAGLLAGAFSMASGEYISVKSQRELYEYQMALESEELKAYPLEEAAELALIYEAKGIDIETAKSLGKKMIENPEQALKTLAREELGLNPDDLGSPIQVAASSFLAFALGAAIPLLPFMVGHYEPVLRLNILIGLSLVSLFGVGAVLSLFSGRNAFWGGARLAGIGTIAGALTFVIGRWFST